MTSAWIGLLDSFIDDTAVVADLHGLAIVTLQGRHEFDAAVAVLVVLPVNELGDPMTGLGLATERFTRVIRTGPSAGFNDRIECVNDDPREAAGASFCPFCDLATPSPGQ